MTNSRQKGARAERQLAKELRKYGYEDARRGQQFSGANGDPDVVGMSDKIHIECKCTDAGHGKLYEWLDQSKNDAREGEIPVVMHKRQSQKVRGKQWLVTLELNDFIGIWRKAYGKEDTIQENL